ncbi:MAG: 2-hydroxyacyl-CoA dehydratase family protein [Oscillospiraceae bacterium]|nr:2-hydroxyacyl-CoA dehydratase family protein [Oscillospiraceae bacterium]
MSELNLESMSAKQLLAYYSEKAYQDANEAHKNGKLICWSASVAPSEFCDAMDICTVYPENHAAAIGARKGSPALLELAEKKGYSIDCCSYARVNFGYLELLKEEALTGVTPQALADAPADRLPLPDLVITCNNLCNTLLKWYENLAAELHIPCIVIDVPFNHTVPMPQYAKDYVKSQFQYAIEQLEQICGRPFDYDKFLEVQKQAQRSVAAWDRVAKMTSYKPSPMNGFDFFNYMALIVCARSKKDSEIVFNKLADELEEKLKKGEYAFGDNEKFRFTWEGIACWPYLGHTFKSLRSLGVLLTGSGYPGMWSLHYTPGNMDEMAEAYASIYTNVALPEKVDAIGKVIEGGKCDGIAYHINRSCKIMSFLTVETADMVKEKTKVPFVTFDGDQTDPSNFSPAQFDTRVQALAEMMEQEAAEKDKKAQ